jgi:hypothetical protein
LDRERHQLLLWHEQSGLNHNERIDHRDGCLYSESNSNSDADRNTNTNTNTNTDSDTHANTDSNSNTDANPNAEYPGHGPNKSVWAYIYS